MSHKTIVRWALIVLVAFVTAIVVFPMLYNPVESTVPADEPSPSLEIPSSPATE